MLASMQSLLFPHNHLTMDHGEQWDVHNHHVHATYIRFTYDHKMG